MLVIIGSSWLGKKENDSLRINDPLDYPRLEIAAAFKKKLPVIPVLLRGAEIPNENILPSEIGELSYRSGVRIRPDPDFGNDIDRLISGIDHILS